MQGQQSTTELVLSSFDYSNTGDSASLTWAKSGHFYSQVQAELD